MPMDEKRRGEIAWLLDLAEMKAPRAMYLSTEIGNVANKIAKAEESARILSKSIHGCLVEVLGENTASSPDVVYEYIRELARVAGEEKDTSKPGK
jgi:hypothetical protein